MTQNVDSKILIRLQDRRIAFDTREFGYEKPLLTLLLFTSSRGNLLLECLSSIHAAFESLGEESSEVELCIMKSGSDAFVSRSLALFDGKRLPRVQVEFAEKLHDDLLLAAVEDQVRGQYLLTIGEDDALETSALKDAVTALRNTPTALLLLGARLWYRDTQEIEPLVAPKELLTSSNPAEIAMALWSSIQPAQIVHRDLLLPFATYPGFGRWFGTRHAIFGVIAQRAIEDPIMDAAPQAIRILPGIHVRIGTLRSSSKDRSWSDGSTEAFVGFYRVLFRTAEMTGAAGECFFANIISEKTSFGELASSRNSVKQLPFIHSDTRWDRRINRRIFLVNAVPRTLWRFLYRVRFSVLPKARFGGHKYKRLPEPP